MRAKDLVPSGMPEMMRGGGLLSPSQVYAVGIMPPSAKAGLVIVKPGVDGAGREGVVIVEPYHAISPSRIMPTPSTKYARISLV
jgi:hypothetical protein